MNGTRCTYNLRQSSTVKVMIYPIEYYQTIYDCLIRLGADHRLKERFVDSAMNGYTISVDIKHPPIGQSAHYIKEYNIVSINWSSFADYMDHLPQLKMLNQELADIKKRFDNIKVFW